MDITPYLQLLLTFIGLILTGVLIPWIKTKIDAGHMAKITKYVDVFVLAAEQLYGAGNGREKLEYVAAALRAKGYILDIDSVTDEVRAMIEAAVRGLGEAEIKAV